jgi:hypothetical protein
VADLRPVHSLLRNQCREWEGNFLQEPAREANGRCAVCSGSSECTCFRHFRNAVDSLRWGPNWVPWCRVELPPIDSHAARVYAETSIHFGPRLWLLGGELAMLPVWANYR